MPDGERKESEPPPSIVRRDGAPNELRLDSRWAAASPQTNCLGRPSSGENQRSILGDDHWVLKLSNEAPVSRSKRPSVRVINDMVCGDGQEGLDGEDQAFAKDHPLAVIDARDWRRLMEFSPNAVAIEILDDAKPVTPCSLLDRPTEITEPSAWLSSVHCIALSMLGGFEEPGGHGGDLADSDADTCVREVAVQLGRHVEVHEVTIA
jgi:hypothetical protein